MFIEQGIKPENPFWKYLVGSVIVIGGAFVGQLPMLFAIFIKSIKDNKTFPTTEDDVMRFFSPNQTLFWLLLSFVFAMGAFIFVVKFLHKQSMRSVTTARKKVDWGRILFSFGIWAVIMVALTLIDYYSSPQDYELNFKPMSFAILCVIAITMIPIQTSTEEYVFRGYLMQGFGGLAKNRWFPLLMTSLIFGGMHILNPEVDKMGYSIMAYYIGTGLFLGIMTLMDDGMELSLGFHAANNLIGALLVTSDWSALRSESIFKDVSEPSAGYDVMLPVVVIFPILLFIFSKKYRWTNWKEKLTGEIQEKHLNTFNDNDNYTNSNSNL
jgi:membrane protease YdiL (CAAX protease family)